MGDVIEHIETTKAYWAQWDLLELSVGGEVLYRKWIAGDEHTMWLQLIPPMA